MEERRFASVAAELGLTLDQVHEAQAVISTGLAEALAGGLIRFEDALFELSQ